MEIETLTTGSNIFSEQRAEAIEGAWVILSSRQNPSPLKHPGIQFLDWKKNGKISHYILGDRDNEDRWTILPSQKDLGCPFLFLTEVTQFNWDRFFKACASLKLVRACCLFENPLDLASSRKSVEKAKDIEFPHRLILA